MGSSPVYAKRARMVIDQFANDRRVIVSDWRIKITYSNLATKNDFQAPDATKHAQLLRTLIADEMIRPVEGVSSVYEISVPFASLLPIPTEGVLQEANPVGFFGFRSAFVYHGLTDDLSPELYFYLPGKNAERIPHGTMPGDWSDFSLPRQRKPKKIKNRSIIYTTIKPEWDIGVMTGYIEGIPIYVTDLERTIVDSFRNPMKCGGISSVVEAWIRANDLANFDLEKVVSYVEKIGQIILRQRVGYVFESLGKTHPIFEHWVKNSVRGSSAKLISTEEFSPHFSERWKLSLNLPDSMIQQIEGEGK